MKPSTIIVTCIAIASLVVAALQWKTASELRRQNDDLRAQLEATRAQATNESAEAGQKREADLQKLRAEALELARLRAEVTQLRAGAKDLDSLRARADQLRAENQRLRGASSASSPVPSAPSPKLADSFPRESWSFAGYATPESALVSAIWAMREGNPKTYMESLSPDEQARMSQVWGGKTEADIAAKHQSDVSKITSIRVVDRQEASPEQMTMSVYIGGVDRLEKVSMQKVGNDWKFGGFIRDPKQ